jgi:hypothetical protein
MKKGIRILGMSGLLLVGAIFANAQSSNALVVSKGVQQYANKKAFENEKQNNSHIQAKSVPFPAIVLSKGIARPEAVEVQGNIESKGYPTWAISKGVARQNQEIQRKSEMKNLPSREISTDDQPISKN